MTRIIIQLVLLLAALCASAQVPKTLSFQGYLTDKSTGNPVGGSTDVTRNMNFAIYDALTDGTQLWSESHNDVIVSKGLYHVILGSKGSPLTLGFNQAYYLQVSIEGEVFDKRIEITSSAYSISSINATNITTGILPVAQVPNLNASKITTGTFGTGLIADDAITATKLQDDAVTDANRAVTTNHLRDGNVTNAKLAADIDASKITTGTLPVAQVPDLNASKITSGILPIARGGTNSSTAADARTSLGLIIGTNIQAYDADLDDLADGSLSGSKVGSGINASNVTTGTLPVAQVPNLDASIIGTGTVPINRGGTNSTSIPINGGLAYGTGTAFSFTGAGTTGQILQSNGSGMPTWVSASTLSWTLTGTAGTTDGVNNFVGTTDNVPLNFKVNNQKAGRIDPFGSLFFGYQAGSANTTGVMNTGIGYGALFSNIDGFNNTAIGHQALRSNTQGISNMASGGGALFSNTTGNYNTATGYGSLSYNTIGEGNTASGWLSLESNVSGSRATAIGYLAMRYANNTTTSFINYNVAVGYASLMGSTSPPTNYGNYNTAIGYQSLTSNTSGSSNTASGYWALFSNTTGQANTAYGYSALSSNTSGQGNIANGASALLSNTSGWYNSANGGNALRSNTTGDANTGYGHGSLYSNTTGSNNTAIGYNADVSVANLTNATAIGANAIVSTSNSLVLGNNAKVGIGESSPGYLLDIKTTVANTAMRINKTGSAAAQEYVVFSRNGVSIGNITANASDAMSYNAFTGSHYAHTAEALQIGELVTMTGENHVLNNSPEGEPIYGITRSYIANDSRILGSFFQSLPTDAHKGNPEIKLIMAVGNGEMWVSNNGGHLKVGDYLISSNVKGHAMKDVGLYEVSYVIARAAENVNWEQVTETVEGIKHKKISVFFESFMHNNRAEKLALELNEVKAALEKLKNEIGALTSKTLQTSNNRKIDP